MSRNKRKTIKMVRRSPRSRPSRLGKIDVRKEPFCRPPSGKELRARIGRFFSVAGEICELLEKRGIKRHEGCTVRRLTEMLWDESHQQRDRDTAVCEAPMLDRRP